MLVAVIGGGPAGMMAAISAAERGADVTLYEQNEKLGKKLYISGKGRCNITNDCAPMDFISNVVTNEKFLLGPINKFSSADTVNFCRKNGLELKTERGNRVFPLSDKSSDVIKIFDSVLRKLNVKICLNSQILSISTSKRGFLLTTITDIYEFDRVILATGGLSYSLTGSRGDGYKFAAALGHDIIKPRPALCRIICSGVSALEGLALKNVETAICNADGNIVDSEFGEMLFTKDGVSGPAVLTLSSRINKLQLKNTYVSIDLKPALTIEQLDARILRDFSVRMNKDFINSLTDLLPERIIKEVAVQSGIPFYKKVNQISAAERAKLVQTFKGLKFLFSRLDDIEHAIVTAGGVDVKQIDPSTMQSRLCKGLYFAGELIDIDAYTGGFNIQIALSTGYVAGKSAALD